MSHGAVPSPCINVCQLDARQRHCTGCLRLIDEIAGWSRMSDERKRAVHAAIEQRRAQGWASVPAPPSRPSAS